MGNHEFCLDCYESDFHHGRPCDPVKLEKVRLQKQKIQDIKNNHHEEVEKKLKGLGIEYHYDGNCFTIY